MYGVINILFWFTCKCLLIKQNNRFFFNNVNIYLYILVVLHMRPPTPLPITRRPMMRTGHLLYLLMMKQNPHFWMPRTLSSLHWGKLIHKVVLEIIFYTKTMFYKKKVEYNRVKHYWKYFCKGCKFNWFNLFYMFFYHLF